MKACIISYHDSHDYNTRMKYLEAFLRSKGYEVETLISDFDHINKCEYHVERRNTQLIHVKPYTKNLSFERIHSYVGFAKSCAQCLSKQEKVDLVYLLAPPNSLIKELSLLKNKMKFQFIVEVGDMWPESLPISGTVKNIGKPAFYLWRRIRDKYINQADYVITECDLFKNRLKENGLVAPCKRVYFCKEALYGDDTEVEFGEEVRICYIGSINNIIDIAYIGKLVKRLAGKRKVRFDIIGKGENENALCDEITNSGGICCFHGPIYDSQIKHSIISKCHFALNVMKESVFVGMTMKSLDYFSVGLPIINNILGDTWDVVESYGCGINGTDPEEVADKINELDQSAINQFRYNARKTHMDLFSITEYEKQMCNIMESISEDNNQ